MPQTKTFAIAVTALHEHLADTLPNLTLDEDSFRDHATLSDNTIMLSIWRTYADSPKVTVSATMSDPQAYQEVMDHSLLPGHIGFTLTRLDTDTAAVAKRITTKVLDPMREAAATLTACLQAHTEAADAVDAALADLPVTPKAYPAERTRRGFNDEGTPGRTHYSTGEVRAGRKGVMVDMTIRDMTPEQAKKVLAVLAE